MKKRNGILFALALVTIATLTSSNVNAQNVSDGQLVRIRYADTWAHIPIDVVVKTFTIMEPWYYGMEGPFVGQARVLFTNEAASYFEPGVNRNPHDLFFLSDTVLMPGTRLRIEPLDFREIPYCGDLAHPTTEACSMAPYYFFQSVLVTNK